MPQKAYQLLRNITSESNIDELWEAFKTENRRNFEPEEDAERFEIFKTHINKVVAHNAKFAKGEVTFQIGVNQFSDRKPEEFKTGLIKPETSNEEDNKTP